MMNLDANLTTAYTAQLQPAVEATVSAPPVAPVAAAEQGARTEDKQHQQQGRQDDKAQEAKQAFLAEVADDNRPVQVVKRELSFELSQSENRVIIEVIDAENDEVIRRIPPEELNKLEEALGDLKGLFVDSNV